MRKRRPRSPMRIKGFMASSIEVNWIEVHSGKVQVRRFHFRKGFPLLEV